ncbi:MAG: hypothetical protein IAG13_08280 [Deltaproteobacteria bacterium]|nr:hypothetical protein [Nannocystaceae bacterium]
MLALADVALADAARIIARREQAYRYPAAQTHGGGLTPETALANGTTYPYRVHTKTHLLTYWHNRHDEVAVILAGGVPQDPGRVSIRDAIAAIGEPLTIGWPLLEPLSGVVTIAGVGVLEPPATDFALDDARGTFDVTGLLTAGDRDIAVSGTIARTDVRATTARAGLTLVEPANPTAQGVLASVFPALEWGLLLEPDAEQGTLVLAHDLDEDAVVDHDAVTRTELVADGDTFTSSAVTFDIPVALASGGAPVAVTLRDVVFSGAVVAGGFDTAVDASGAIELVDLVDALQVLAGFDEDGALAALAGLLEFDPDAPPDTVPFVASFATEAAGG